MKASSFILRGLVRFAEHLAGAGEVEARVGAGIFETREHVMGAVNIDVHGGELVVKRITDEALRREVIALVRLYLEEDTVETREIFKRRAVKVNLAEQMLDSRHSVGWVLQSDPPHDAVNLIAFLQQELGEVRPVLAGDARD